MSKITVELTEQQEKFLKEFALKHYEGSEHNVLTRHPIHLVQSQREITMDPDYDVPDIYDTVAVFYIRDNAKKYIEYQGHNLFNPRIYTVGAGYANKGEYHHFWELLFNLGKQLISQEGEV